MSEDEPYFISQAEMVVEINRLRAENETLRRDVKTAVMGDSAELQDVKRENEKLREALKPFAELAVAVEKQYENCLPPEEHFTGVGYGHLRAAAAAIRESGE